LRKKFSDRAIIFGKNSLAIVAKTSSKTSWFDPGPLGYFFYFLAIVAHGSWRCTDRSTFSAIKSILTAVPTIWKAAFAYHCLLSDNNLHFTELFWTHIHRVAINEFYHRRIIIEKKMSYI